MNTAFRRLTYVLAVLIVGAYVIVALRGPQGIPALLEKRKQIRALEEQNANLVREIKAKQERIRKLQVSRSEQEEQIRKDYHLQRPGDVTLMLPDHYPSDTSQGSQPKPDVKTSPANPVTQAQ